MTREEYNELYLRLRAETEESGIKLDLNCPCDRAIISECGLTPEETLAFLAYFDSTFGRNEEDTVRVSLR